MKISLLLLAVFAIVFQCFAQPMKTAAIGNVKFSYTPHADSLAQNQHLIAIAPPSVSNETSEEIDSLSHIERQKTESIDFQMQMYKHMLNKRITSEIQNVDTSVAILKRAGYYDGTPLSPDEICRILGVDGVITSNFIIAKPSGGEVGLGILFGTLNLLSFLHGSPTSGGGSVIKQSVTGSIGIYDFKTKKMIWNFDQRLTVRLLNTPVHVVNALMRNASMYMPYTTKQKKSI